MKVILSDNVVKLGQAGDIVEAAPGYFRNFLQPRKLAVIATKGALKKREEEVEILRKKAEKAHQLDLALCERITTLGSVKVSARAGEEGKLYGKVTTKEIAEILKKELGQEIDKRLLKVNQEITTLGTYSATVKLSANAHADFNVVVIAE